jgi:hypothetical protein
MTPPPTEKIGLEDPAQFSNISQTVQQRLPILLLAALLRHALTGR